MGNTAVRPSQPQPQPVHHQQHQLKKHDAGGGGLGVDVCVDGGRCSPPPSTDPTCVYPSAPRDWDHGAVLRLIVARRLAPFYPGLDDPSSPPPPLPPTAKQSHVAPATPAQVRYLALLQHPNPSSTPMETNPSPPPPTTSTMDDRVVNPNRRTLSQSLPMNSQQQQTTSLRGRRSLTLSAGNSSLPQQQPDLTTTSDIIPRNVLYRYTVECPICFLNYPANINYTRCCDYPICSECFVQIKRSEPNFDPAACPFCVEPHFGILYHPIASPQWANKVHDAYPTDFPTPIHLALTVATQPSSTAEGSNSPIPSPITSPPLPAPPNLATSQQTTNNNNSSESSGNGTGNSDNKPRRKFVSYRSADVVSSDDIRPDWQRKQHQLLLKRVTSSRTGAPIFTSAQQQQQQQVAFLGAMQPNSTATSPLVTTSTSSPTTATTTTGPALAANAMSMAAFATAGRSNNGTARLQTEEDYAAAASAAAEMAETLQHMYPYGTAGDTNNGLGNDTSTNVSSIGGRRRRVPITNAQNAMYINAMRSMGTDIEELMLVEAIRQSLLESQNNTDTDRERQEQEQERQRQQQQQQQMQQRQQQELIEQQLLHTRQVAEQQRRSRQSSLHSITTTGDNQPTTDIGSVTEKVTSVTNTTSDMNQQQKQKEQQEDVEDKSKPNVFDNDEANKGISNVTESNDNNSQIVNGNSSHDDEVVVTITTDSKVKNSTSVEDDDDDDDGITPPIVDDDEHYNNNNNNTGNGGLNDDNNKSNENSNDGNNDGNNDDINGKKDVCNGQMNLESDVAACTNNNNKDVVTVDSQSLDVVAEKRVNTESNRNRQESGLTATDADL